MLPNNNPMVKYKYIIFSIIIGFLFGYIIYYIYNKQITIVHGPDSNIIRNNIYIGKNKKYYKLIPNICFCPI